MYKFYLVSIGDTISVYHRNTHFLFGVFSTANIKELKEVLSFSDKEIYTEIIKRKGYIPPEHGLASRANNFEEKEKWYGGAWKQTTEKLIKKYKLKMPKNEPIDYSLVKEIKRSLESKWAISPAKNFAENKIKKGTVKKNAKKEKEKGRQDNDGHIVRVGKVKIKISKNFN